MTILDFESPVPGRIRTPHCLLASAAVLLLGILPSPAQGTVFTDRSTYTAALQSSTTINFAGLPDPPPGIGRSPITISGVTFTNAESRLFTGSSYLWNFDSSYPVGIYLPNGMNAFGADFSGGIDPQNNPFNATITVNLVGGQSFTHNFTGTVGSWTFVGFVFPQNIQSLVYNDGGPFLPGAHEEMLDNVVFGVAVPEPSATTLGLFGVLASVLVRRRSRQSQKSKPILIGCSSKALPV